MSIGIQNNAMTQLKLHEEAKRQASARLASGQQINKASEGAAELSAFTALKATIQAASTGLSNASRGVALGQVADGALSQVGELLQRMKELTVSGNSSTFGVEDKIAAQAEFAKLRDSITAIADTTRYAGNVLMDGSLADVSIQTGEKAEDTTSFSTINLKDGVFDLSSGDVSSDAAAAGELVDGAIAALAAARAEVGAFMVGLESTISVNQVKIENLETAASVFIDADLAKEATNLAMADIRGQMAQSMIAKENQALSNQTSLVR